MRIALICPLLFLGATGCRPALTGIDAVVVEATLSNHEAIALVILGGATWGEANLSFTDADGLVREVPVAFAGPSAGLAMDVHVTQEDLLFTGSDSAALRLPEGGVPVDDLFGLYDGSGGSIALGLGYCDLQLDNPAGVSLVINGACGGFGMVRSENWLTFSADGEVTEPPL